MKKTHLLALAASLIVAGSAHSQQPILEIHNLRSNPVDYFQLNGSFENFLGTIQPNTLVGKRLLTGSTIRLKEGFRTIQEHTVGGNYQRLVLSLPNSSGPSQTGGMSTASNGAENQFNNPNLPPVNLPPVNLPPLPPKPYFPPVDPPPPVVNFDGNRETINLHAPNLEAIRKAIVRETNRVRATRGLPPFRVSSQLGTAAQIHSDDMVRLNFNGHYNLFEPAKETVWQRVASTGYRAQSVGENWIKEFGIKYKAGSLFQYRGGVFLDVNGNRIPTETVDSLAAKLVASWMASPPHKEAIISQNTDIGVGIAFYRDSANSLPTFKAIQVFGTPMN